MVSKSVYKVKIAPHRGALVIKISKPPTWNVPEILSKNYKKRESTLTPSSG